MDGARKEPSGLFTTLLPAAAAAARERAMQAPANGATHNRWREIVPDLVISNDGVSRTYDLKIISYGAQYRPAAEVAAPRQAGAVNTRADKVAGEYLRAAQKLDREAVGVAAGAVGPIESAVRTHGGVIGLHLWSGHFVPGSARYIVKTCNVPSR